MTGEEDMRRLEELAVSRLLEPLSTDEALEYAALKRRLGRFDDAAIEHVVALAHLAVLPDAEPVPSSLREAVAKDADEFFANRTPQNRIASDHAAVGTGRSLPVKSAGWGLAAAASIALVFAWLHRGPAIPVPTRVAESPSAATATPMITTEVPPHSTLPPRMETQHPATEPPAVDGASEWRAFLASHPHAVERAWRAGGDPTGERVTGAVIWDEASQTGYLRFVNLRRNEPNTEQYQLWIFDAGRDQRYPVDGGVFDVTASGGEQIIPIHAKLRVRVPLMFAVTVEHPGGVVVSDRSRIAAIANIT
jgi:hypothetical protein